MEISWKIEQLERQLPDGGVVTAHWRATSVDGNFSSTAYGTVGFTPDPDAPNFVPYDELTEDDVLAWVWGQLDKEATEESLSAQIELQKNPPIKSGLPW